MSDKWSVERVAKALERHDRIDQIERRLGIGQRLSCRKSAEHSGLDACLT
jgi:hypothetical protein